MGSCESCRFWKHRKDLAEKQDRGTAYGTCRRRAPSCQTESGIDAFWPDTYTDDWCGEYEQGAK